MKNVLFFLGVLVMSLVCYGNSFEIFNKTNFPIKTIFSYATPFCIQDMRDIAPFSSTGRIEMAGCQLDQMSAQARGPEKDLKVNTLTGLARPGHSVIEVLEHPTELKRLIMRLRNENNAVIRKTANDTGN